MGQCSMGTSEDFQDREKKIQNVSSKSTIFLACHSLKESTGMNLSLPLSVLRNSPVRHVGKSDLMSFTAEQGFELGS